MSSDSGSPRDRDWLILVNPLARGGGRRVAKVEAALRAHGTRAQVMVTNSAEEVRALAREASNRDVVLAVLGGDGTANDAASQLIGGRAWFAHLPGGGENLIGRAAGAGSDPIRAVGHLLEGKARRWDVGLLDGYPFLGFAGIGFDGEVCARAEAARCARFGNASYWGATAVGLLSRPTRFRVTWEGGNVDECHEMVVSNIPIYGGGLRVNPRADPGDGCLDLALFRWKGYINRVGQLLTLSRFGPREPAVSCGVTRFRTRELTVHATGPLPVQVDGNPARTDNPRVWIRPAAVWVIESA